MTEKTTSLKIDPELWKRAKISAVKRGTTLKSMIQDLLLEELGVEEPPRGEEPNLSKELLQALRESRREDKVPFVILTRKRAVELVREGRGH